MPRVFVLAAPLGRTWTTLIGLQIAIAVAILPEPIFTTADWIRAGFATPGFAAEKMVIARLDMEPTWPRIGEAQTHDERFAQRFDRGISEVLRRLDAESGVALTTFASAVPGQEPTARIELEGTAAVEPGHRVRPLHVGPRFFQVFDARIIVGRGLQPGDADPPGERSGGTVVVNRAFATHLLGDRPAVGGRLRYLDSEPEHQRERSRGTRSSAWSVTFLPPGWKRPPRPPRAYITRRRLARRSPFGSWFEPPALRRPRCPIGCARSPSRSTLRFTPAR